MKDITDSKGMMGEKQKTVELLELVNRARSTRELMETLSGFFRDWLDVEAVGVRLRDECDYPYYETAGFPEAFVMTERYLCEQDQDGQVMRDEIGNPSLECMCGNILSGRFDPSKPFFTENGSFWTNSTSDLLATTTEADRQARTRNRCHGDGYESVALIPLRAWEETYGLLQLNDTRRDRFTPYLISLLERMADQVAFALSGQLTKDALQRETKVNRVLADLAGSLISSPDDIQTTAELVLTYAKELTGCDHGYVSEIDPKTGDNVGHTLTDMMGDLCRVSDQKVAFPIGDDGTYPGLWGHSLNTLNPLYTEQPETHPSSRGLPEGHVPLHNLLSVPVKIEGALVGQIALANSENVYSDSVIRAIEQLAELYAIAIQRHRSETESFKLREQLERAQKMEAIGTLAGGIAHDFNNILTPFIIHTEMSILELDTGHPVQNHLKEALKAGHRSRDLVKQILAFSRQKENEFQAFKVGTIVREVIKLLRATLPSTIEIVQDLTAGSDTIVADPTQIHQVLMNLCTNAAHAMRDKGGILRLVLESVELGSGNQSDDGGLEPGTYLKLTVADSGIGIDTEVLPQIFDPYFTTKGKAEGTGLGLSVVHGIVKSHRGRITVDSEVGKGTEFQVIFPMLARDQTADHKLLHEMTGGTERILYVDDEQPMVDTVQPMLEHLGYRVTSHVSSIRALEAYESEPDAFDLVITDQTMPEMTGANMALKMLKVRPDIPIILCTGFSEKIDEVKSKEIGIRSFVMKPIVMHEISRVIREVLEAEFDK